MIPQLGQLQWTLAIVAAFCAGLSKAGFVGMGLVAVIVFANIFGARDSTGVVLPLFIAADFGAVGAFRQHARWDYIRRTLPPAAAGVVIGTLIMQRMDNASFRPVLGAVILALTLMQLARLRWPDVYGSVPHSRGLAWTLGLLAGMATMMANAAGPLVALYFVAVGLPKFEVVGTLAWFFFIINLFKVPFSAGIGVIDAQTLMFDAMLVPAVFAGLLAGRWLIHRVPQRAFDTLMLAFAGIAAVRLLAR
ncbi:MAG TPA: sulfite exporter TauE/SafE family protein [Gemmatimonadaceae bacterium]|nr:sulfite exporter TauE/SafE family protein [Gemmatimonadaceae bacterium]